MEETHSPENTDYFQLWLENEKENQLLTKQLTHSKQAVINLQLKFIEFLCSMKTLEASLDLEALMKRSGKTADLFQMEEVHPQISMMDITSKSSHVTSPRISETVVNDGTVLQERGNEISQDGDSEEGKEKYSIVTSGSRKLFVCKVCNKAFSFLSILKSHYRSHAGDKPQITSSPDKRIGHTSRPSLLVQKGVACKFCGRRFNQSIQLLRHQVVHRQESREVKGQEGGPSVVAAGNSVANAISSIHSQAAHSKVLDKHRSLLPDLNPDSIPVKQEPSQMLVHDMVCIEEVDNSLENSSVTESPVENHSSMPTVTVNYLSSKGVESIQSSHSHKAFAVVEFQDNQVAVVCSSWLFSRNNCRCYWPPENPSKQAIDQAKPAANWTVCDVEHVLAYAHTYEEANRKLRKSEFTSELSSDCSDIEKKKRKIRKRKKFTDSSDDGEDGSLNEGSRCGKSPARSKGRHSWVNTERQLPWPSSNSNSNADIHAPNVVLDHQYSYGSDVIEQPLETSMTSPASDSGRLAINLIGDIENSFSTEGQLLHAASASQYDPAFLGANFQLTVLSTLDEMRQEGKQMLSLLNRFLLESSVSADLNDLEIDGMPSLPLQTMEDLDHMEMIMDDKDLRLLVVKHFGSFGGATIQETTKRILSRLVSSHLALHFNWAGRKGKRGFSFLQLKKVVIDAVRRNVATKNADEKNIEEVIKMWFRTAADRDGGREQRGRQRLDKEATVAGLPLIIESKR